MATNFMSNWNLTFQNKKSALCLQFLVMTFLQSNQEFYVLENSQIYIFFTFFYFRLRVIFGARLFRQMPQNLMMES